MFETVLEELGLSKGEATCYLALLQLGETTTGPLVKKSSIPSSKIYIVLDKLIQRGLASYVFKGKRKHFCAAHPETLLAMLDEKRAHLKQILPQLPIVQPTHAVTVLDGYTALFSHFTQLIEKAKRKELYLVFALGEEAKDEQARRFLRTLTLRRKDKGIDVRLLRSKTYYRKEQHTKLQIRYTSLHLPQGITIFRNEVILVSWQEHPVGIAIESAQFADEFRTFFLDMWKHAHP